MTLWVTILTLSLAASASQATQQEAASHRPISSIRDATWEKYKGMYLSNPLCSKNEITLWSCETSKKTHALCSSTQVNRRTGYIQYRVSRNGNIVFEFPNSRIPPVGLFTYQTSANGDAYLAFSNGGYSYSLIDPLRDRSVIFVTANRSPNRTSRSQCASGNQTLQVNYTMRLMYDAGIWTSH